MIFYSFYNQFVGILDKFFAKMVTGGGFSEGRRGNMVGGGRRSGS